MLAGKSVVLGITGGIAAYKMVEVASALVKEGVRVDVIMTEAAQRFVTPLTFQTITKRPVITDLFQAWTESDRGHISLAERADVIVVAPATANTIAKMTAGIADNMLLTVILASRAPVVVAPAMDAFMYANPVTQENIGQLIGRGFEVIPPERGWLASGLEGEGRLAEPRAIFGTIRQLLGRKGTLASRTVVVTAGGTREPVDPVRFIGNSSSGKMGYAIAQAAIDEGAKVRLISGPVSLTPPVGVEFSPVITTLEMQSAVERAVEGADALIMAAAVADYRPSVRAEQKIKKNSERLVIELDKNPDILKSLKERKLFKVGFAAETEDLVDNARTKLAEKGLDLIIANDATATIGRDDAAVFVIERTGSVQGYPALPKTQVAAQIVELVAARLNTTQKP
jgi:phosphopantothenoylcysteine decarboxylase / phosphopantothenate---cysteine ligase